MRMASIPSYFRRAEAAPTRQITLDRFCTSSRRDLVGVQEEGNPWDRHAVATVKDGSVVRHLLKKYSQTIWWFVHCGDTIQCAVTGGRKYPEDLVQGGLEVPCSLTTAGLVYKPKRAIQRTNYMYMYLSLSAHVPYTLMLYTSE